jgi:hypothetical protein
LACASGSLLERIGNSAVESAFNSRRGFQRFPFEKSRDSVIKRTLVALSIPTGRILFAPAGLKGERLVRDAELMRHRRFRRHTAYL